MFRSWDDMFSSQPELDREEQTCLEQIQDAERRLHDWKESFTRRSRNLSSREIERCIEELDDFAIEVQSWRSTTTSLSSRGRPVCSERLEGLIEEVSSTRPWWEFTRRSRAAFEDFQQGQSGGWGSPRQGGGWGSPRWRAATAGFSCYWCGRTLVGLPTTVDFCPYCGRVPRP